MTPPVARIAGLPAQATRWYDAYIFDMDGTVFLGDALLPTAGATLATLRDLGKRTVFLSNNPTRTHEEYVAKLNRLGVPASRDDIIHSSQVMVNYLRRRTPEARLFVVGEEPLKKELSRPASGSRRMHCRRMS